MGAGRDEEGAVCCVAGTQSSFVQGFPSSQFCADGTEKLYFSVWLRNRERAKNVR